jgi:hypothetical protein
VSITGQTRVSQLLTHWQALARQKDSPKAGNAGYLQQVTVAASFRRGLGPASSGDADYHCQWQCQWHHWHHAPPFFLPQLHPHQGSALPALYSNLKPMHPAACAVCCRGLSLAVVVLHSGGGAGTAPYLCLTPTPRPPLELASWLYV